MELKQGAVRSHDLQKLVDVYQRVDRDADWYDKTVRDPDTNEIIYERHEPLSDHTDRGDAKRPRPKK